MAKPKDGISIEELISEIQRDTIKEFKEILKREWKPTAKLGVANQVTAEITPAGIKRFEGVGAKAAQVVLQRRGISDTIAVETKVRKNGHGVVFVAEAKVRLDGLAQSEIALSDLTRVVIDNPNKPEMWYEGTVQENDIMRKHIQHLIRLSESERKMLVSRTKIELGNWLVSALEKFGVINSTTQKAIFIRWWSGSGLNFKFDAGINIVDQRINSVKHILSTKQPLDISAIKMEYIRDWGNLMELDAVRVDMKPHLAIIGGSDRVYYDPKAQKIVGFVDYFNFDWKSRGLLVETVTRIYGVLGALYGARDMYVHGGKHPTLESLGLENI